MNCNVPVVFDMLSIFKLFSKSFIEICLNLTFLEMIWWQSIYILFLFIKILIKECFAIFSSGWCFDNIELLQNLSVCKLVMSSKSNNFWLLVQNLFSWLNWQTWVLWILKGHIVAHILWKLPFKTSVLVMILRHYHLKLLGNFSSSITDPWCPNLLGHICERVNRNLKRKPWCKMKMKIGVYVSGKVNILCNRKVNVMAK